MTRDSSRMVANDADLLQPIFGAGLCFLSLFGWLCLATSFGSKPLVADASLAVLPACFFAIGAAMVLSSCVVTVSVDRLRGEVLIRHRWLLKKTERVIPLDTIEAVDLEVKCHTDSDDAITSRVVIRRTGYSAIPLRRSFSNENKRSVANQLRAMFGVGGRNGYAKPGTYDELRLMRKMWSRQEINDELRHRQEVLTGPNNESRITENVNWHLESAEAFQAIATHVVAVTKWFSADFQIKDAFVYIAQRSPAGGINQTLCEGRAGQNLMKMSLKTWRFQTDDLPKVDSAELIAVAGLAPHFVAMSSDTAVASMVLNERVVEALATWGHHHSLSLGFTENKPLSVLFSPRGVYVLTLGTLDVKRLEELAAVGAELVNANR